MRKLMMLALVALTAVVAAASGFEPVPEAARTALRGTRGKPFTAGLLFCDGACVKPPYRVARYGTAIFVNDRQVTGQIVPWRTFLATQEGYVAPEPPKPEAVEAKKPKAAADDLFDDAPAQPDPAAKPSAPAAKPSAPAAEEAPVAFRANAKSAALVKKVNAARVEIQRKLKDGYICFYGARYPRVIVEPRVAKSLLAVLPEAISDAPDGAALAAAMRAKGFAFMGRELCEDLVRNRADYPKILERRRALEEEEALRRMMERAREGAR